MINPQSTFNKEKYDEDDKEVAEALGETPVEDVDVDDIEDIEDEKFEIVPETPSFREDSNQGVWPEPPHLSADSKTLVESLVSDALQQRSEFYIGF